MFNPLAVLGGVGSLWETVFGSKQDRDTANAKINTSIHSQYASEFGNNRNIFDSVIDGLNRFPRPTFAFGIIYIFVMCWRDPDQFAKGASNLDLIPMEMWGILSIILTFYFGDRVIKGWGKHKIREHVAKNKQKLTSVNSLPKHEHEHDGIEWKDKLKTRYNYND